MRFINRGESKKIRIGNFNEDFYWITLHKGETMELPEQTGRNNHLEEVKTTESQIGQVKVETKQFEYTPDDLFLKELKSIKGIGKKTAEDIVEWGTKEKLIEKIKLGESLPFRDDVEEQLKRAYGR